jgi:hypothetical protein
MPKAKITKQPTQARVWIEFEQPSDLAEGQRIASLATRMLRRLGIMESSFQYGRDHRGYECFRYEHDISHTYTELADRGHWFNLEHFGREGD